MEKPEIKTYSRDETYVVFINNKPEVHIYRNPFTLMWNAVNKDGNTVLNPDMYRNDLIESVENYLKNIHDFWNDEPSSEKDTK